MTTSASLCQQYRFEENKATAANDDVKVKEDALISLKAHASWLDGQLTDLQNAAAIAKTDQKALQISLDACQSELAQLAASHKAHLDSSTALLSATSNSIDGKAVFDEYYNREVVPICLQMQKTAQNKQSIQMLQLQSQTQLDEYTVLMTLKLKEVEDHQKLMDKQNAKLGASAAHFRAGMNRLLACFAVLNYGQCIKAKDDEIDRLRQEIDQASATRDASVVSVVAQKRAPSKQMNSSPAASTMVPKGRGDGNNGKDRGRKQQQQRAKGGKKSKTEHVTKGTNAAQQTAASPQPIAAEEAGQGKWKTAKGNGGRGRGGK